MKKRIVGIYFKLMLIFSFLIFNSCGRTQETSDCFPSSPISVFLNLSLPAYQNLQNVGGWIYVNEQGSGTHGLIVVRNSNGFSAYDRNAPHLCPDNTTTLKVEKDIKIVCPKDGAEWILLTGEPISVAKIPPKRYATSYDSASKTLSIYY